MAAAFEETRWHGWIRFGEMESKNGRLIYRSNRITRGRAGQGGPDLTFETVNGSIRLRYASSVALISGDRPECFTRQCGGSGPVIPRMDGGVTVKAYGGKDVIVETHESTRPGRDRDRRRGPAEADGMKRLELPGNAVLAIDEEENVVNIRTRRITARTCW